MNNDRQLVKSFLNTLGIGFSEYAPNGVKTIHCEANVDSRVGGYTGFCAEFTFDSQDNFLCLNVWE